MSADPAQGSGDGEPSRDRSRVKPSSSTTRCAKSRPIRISWPEPPWHGAFLWGGCQTGRESLLAFPGENRGLEALPGERLLRLAAGGPLAGTPACPVCGRSRYAESIRSPAALRCRLSTVCGSSESRRFNPFSSPVRPGTVVDSYVRAIERLIRLPSTLIHGEFYASNILVQETREGCRICPVDWEMAAVGPGLIDLAALTLGSLVRARANGDGGRLSRHAALRRHAGLPLDDLLLALDDCRLHLAIRWLGWAPDWSPPAENAHDWLARGIALS